MYWGPPEFGPPHPAATAAGLSITHLPSPAIPRVTPTDPGHMWHPQPARHSRHHRWHCGGRDGGLRQRSHIWTGRVRMSEVLGRSSSLFPSPSRLPAVPLGPKTISVPVLPQSGPLFHGPLSPTSVFPQQSETIRSVRCPHVADGKAEAQGLLSLGARSHLWGGSKWLVAWPLRGALTCLLSRPQACPCL